MRACVDAAPVIDGRRANCNLASLGVQRSKPSTPKHGTKCYLRFSCFTILLLFHAIYLDRILTGYTWEHYHLFQIRNVVCNVFHFILHRAGDAIYLMHFLFFDQQTLQFIGRFISSC